MNQPVRARALRHWQSTRPGPCPGARAAWGWRQARRKRSVRPPAPPARAGRRLRGRPARQRNGPPAPAAAPSAPHRRNRPGAIGALTPWTRKCPARSAVPAILLPARDWCRGKQARARCLAEFAAEGLARNPEAIGQPDQPRPGTDPWRVEISQRQCPARLDQLALLRRGRVDHASFGLAIQRDCHGIVSLRRFWPKSPGL